ncbi:nucleophile aminohydrolase, partial [Thamnocephalis sphaerospora]
FNCGKGAVFTKGGKNELEACIADGRTGLAGSATLLHRVKNPIRLARQVLLHSPHFFLGGPSAEEFAASRQLEIVDPVYFWTPYRWRQHIEGDDREANRKGGRTESAALDAFASVAVGDVHPKGTVGAVALDHSGNIAAATSTGGRNNKWDGRIGDTPILGAGSYAPIGNSCGVSCTGNGEFYIQYAVAHDVCARMRYLSEDVRTAGTSVVEELRSVGGEGGLIALDAQGNIAMPFNTSGMYRGYCRAGEKPRVFIFPDEDEGL